MKVFIITEGGKNIGFGHITRCLSLYQAFEEKEIIPEFVLNSDDNIEYLLKGINYQKLNWIEKSDKLFELIKDADIAIIDSYLADSSFYIQISNLVKIPVYIDDNKRLDYPKGVVLNGNIHAETLNYPSKNGITYLLGTKYTPLRKEFWEVPKKKIKEKIESIMVTFGGDDARNMTPKILRFLKNEYPDIRKNVVIGKSFNNIDKIKKEADYNTKLIYHPNAQKVKEIMLGSDIAISAGGQTLYELARIGVPTIGICVAENQLGSIREWEKMGFLEFEMDISVHLKYLKSKEIRENKSKIGRKYIDGKGGLRIVNEIEGNI
jgi:UDP-2,4-diacetamido-2,4,6-trideoxy-beta-L-altropyranose hydrolase